MKIENFEKQAVLVVGDVMLDTYHTGLVSRISPEAPIPVVRVTDSFSMPGGAANVARNIQGLKARPFVVGVCGNDANGLLLSSLLSKSDIVSHLAVSEYPTITKTRIIGNRQQVVRVDFEHPHMHLPTPLMNELAEKWEAWIPSVAIVVISDYGKGLCAPSLCHQLIEKAHSLGKTVLVDPKGKDWQKYGCADMITPNLKELSDAVGYEVPNEDGPVVKAAQELSARYGFGAILVTRSEKGMTLITENDALHLPTRAREVFDVSGAGDTVIATMAVAMGAGIPIPDAMRLANRAAGIVVGKAGTQPVLLEELCDEMGEKRDKVVSRQALANQLQKLRRQGAKIVFTNGCFDVLHAGHVTYLEKARNLGDVLVVGLNSDASVRQLKGPGRPVNNELARAKVLSSLSFVDFVVVFEEDTPLSLIQEVKPDYLVKGGDYRVEEVVGREFAGQVVLIDFVEGYSTTRILEKMQDSAQSQ